MRLTVRVVAVMLCVASALLVLNHVTNHQEVYGEAPRSEPSSGDRLVVHEWGTFTSFSGSDGGKLEFRPLVDDDLPKFVLDRGRQAGYLRPLDKSRLSVLQRMETPVVYFYTDRQRDVRVRVGFPQGLLTEFYPPVHKMEPAFNPGQPYKFVADSALDWGRVSLIPPDQLKRAPATRNTDKQGAATEQTLLPAATTDNHYIYARKTDAALVHMHLEANEDQPLLPAGDFFEKFLFYRGLGNFALPLTLEAQTDSTYTLTNAGTQPLQSLFLVTVAGDEIRFVRQDQIDAGQSLELVQSPQQSSVGELASAVVDALVAARLYEKEARAMVKTWRSSWFEEQGTRLFYLLPGSLTNSLLPLQIEPQPDEMVRVMVGRLEIMTPEQEAEITQLVQQHAAARAAARAVARATKEPLNEPAVPAALLELGRLAEPALVRVVNITDDLTLRREARNLLRQLRTLYTLGLVSSGKNGKSEKSG